jgi:hypothetical protein
VRAGITNVDSASAVAGHAKKRRRDASTAVEGLTKSNEERGPERRDPLTADLAPVAPYSRPEPLAILLRVLHDGVLASSPPTFGPGIKSVARRVEIDAPSVAGLNRSGEGPQIRRSDRLLRRGGPSAAVRESPHYGNEYHPLHGVILRALSCHAVFFHWIHRSDADFLHIDENDRGFLTRTVMDPCKEHHDAS